MTDKKQENINYALPDSSWDMPEGVVEGQEQVGEVVGEVEPEEQVHLLRNDFLQTMLVYVLAKYLHLDSLYNNYHYFSSARKKE